MSRDPERDVETGGVRLVIVELRLIDDSPDSSLTVSFSIDGSQGAADKVSGPQFPRRASVVAFLTSDTMAEIHRRACCSFDVQNTAHIATTSTARRATLSVFLPAHGSRKATWEAVSLATPIAVLEGVLTQGSECLRLEVPTSLLTTGKGGSGTFAMATFVAADANEAELLSGVTTPASLPPRSVSSALPSAPPSSSSTVTSKASSHESSDSSSAHAYASSDHASGAPIASHRVTPATPATPATPTKTPSPSAELVPETLFSQTPPTPLSFTRAAHDIASIGITPIHEILYVPSPVSAVGGNPLPSQMYNCGDALSFQSAMAHYASSMMTPDAMFVFDCATVRCRLDVYHLTSPPIPPPPFRTLLSIMGSIMSSNAFQNLGGGYKPDYSGSGSGAGGSSDGGGSGSGGYSMQSRRVVRGESWRANSPIAFAGGYAPALTHAQLPSIARASPVKDAQSVIPALSEGVEALREFLSPITVTGGGSASRFLGFSAEIGVPVESAGSISPNTAWVSSTRLARMHSALDYVLRTTHSSSKRALGYAPRDRVSLDPRNLSHGQDVRSIALEMQADDEQRMLLFSKGIVPYLTDIIDHVSADECVARSQTLPFPSCTTLTPHYPPLPPRLPTSSVPPSYHIFLRSRQVLEDAIQVISNLAYCENVQRRIGSLRLVEVLVARMASDGKCAEIAIKTARALATIFWQATPTLTAGVRADVPTIATRLLKEHIALPFPCMKLTTLLVIIAPQAGAPKQMLEAGLDEILAALQAQPWYLQERATGGIGRRLGIGKSTVKPPAVVTNVERLDAILFHCAGM